MTHLTAEDASQSEDETLGSLTQKTLCPSKNLHLNRSIKDFVCYLTELGAWTYLLG